MTMKRNDKASIQRRRQSALARFTMNEARAQSDKVYRAAKEHELQTLKLRLGKNHA